MRKALTAAAVGFVAGFAAGFVVWPVIEAHIIIGW